MHLVALGSGEHDDGLQGVDVQAHGQRLGLGGVEVMFEAKHLWTHGDVGRSSKSIRLMWSQLARSIYR